MNHKPHPSTLLNFNHLNLMANQKTIGTSIQFKGVGVHGNKPVTMTIIPDKDPIYFVRTDLNNAVIPAHFKNVTDTKMSTTLSNEDGARVSTVEHILSALYGCGITRARIEIDGPEVPIMDGSACIFTHQIETVGIQTLKLKERVIEIVKPIHVFEGDHAALFLPNDTFSLTFYFDFAGQMKGSLFAYDWNKQSFHDLIAPARTFGFHRDAQYLWDRGLAKGASLDNTIVLQDDLSVMNPEGLRFDNEFARHKILDAIGDLSLACGLIKGSFIGINSGHGLNNKLLHKLFDSLDSYTITE
jgi:UDP-3-O-[3-hydroxymyristoyl] N-acetylglucosamine deacetylase